ncbi:hypothetical protein [Micromonospora cremea]|uniref:Uncharacterized protein n=1 Tax=Micromonospora cremea TaxID=709881 RepID=A0A1N5TYY9_9ACTN|nr:hypothetical protein [Micromonospora cremea]SIM53771.1 hypothetical protein SAMN04489832_0483 [Micromonospora cremea]
MIRYGPAVGRRGGYLFPVLPGIGSFKDTFGACRTAILLGIDTVDLSIDWYHYLCPDGR